jgi:hypothetical protein
MSLNPQAQGNDVFDVLEGSVSSYFTQLDAVLQQNECVNGQYRTTSSGSYATNCPADMPAFTTVCLSTNGSTIVDMETSYITVDLTFTVALSTAMAPAGANETNCNKLFIGFKNSLDALEKYSIICNATPLYEQAHVGPESVIFTAGLNDMIKATAPYVFTTAENAMKGDNNMCGVYVDYTPGIAAGVPITITFPIKINLSQFLILASIKYLPSWFGRWELLMHFHWRNLVVIPVEPDVVLQSTSPQLAFIAKNTPQYRKDYTTYFTQIGQPFKMPHKLNWNNTTAITTATLTVVNQTLTCSAGKITNCMFDQCTFQVQTAVNDALRAKYMENPLIIPTNVLQYGKFSGQPVNNADGVPFQATLSQSLENCDSVFLLIPNNNFQETCYYQPYLEQVRLQLGEFGTHPARYVRTYDDPRFVAMCLDALNLERSDISSMNKEVARSLFHNRKSYIINNGVLGGVDATEELDLFGDRSNFFIGISLSQVGFQSGTVSSPNTNIPFIFDGSLVRKAGTDSATDKNGWPIETSLIAMFLLDIAIIIQVAPNSDIPIVKKTSKSVV